VWRGQGFPSARMPDEIEPDVADPSYSDVLNLARIERFTVHMPFGIDSIGYHFIPIQPNGRLMIFSAGHSQDFLDEKDVLAAYIDWGFAVLALDMPLFGKNNQPTVAIGGVPSVLTTHNDLAWLDSDVFCPLELFFDPIAAGLNYLDATYSYSMYAMSGLSGGGWATTVYAAIDPRITRAYPVAGSLPVYLRSTTNELGDFEQTYAPLYEIATYLDLYLLGSVGDDRRVLQVFNQYDPCCFHSDGRETDILRYRDALNSRIAAMEVPGFFNVYFDPGSTQHWISPGSTAAIREDLSE
jgi:hypothetical protein